MKCPHCGIEVRDNTVTCGYCGGTIARQKEGSGPGAAKPATAGGSMAQKEAKDMKAPDEQEEEEEGEGGVSAYLQPGEQVLLGSLNVSVKKFFFHAYLTDRRVFLIDTQEKKLKVTAKDITRESIAGCTVEFSEASDPVLVLSIRSADEEIKTMKLVFVQNGMDRSGEVDEWVTLLQEEALPKKSRRKAAPAEPAIPVGEPAPARAARAAEHEEPHPAKKPSKDHEKQPPVKRLLSLYTVEKSEKEGPELPTARGEAAVEEPLKRPPAQAPVRRDVPATYKSTVPPIRKPEVQSAMKVAMKTAMQPAGQPPKKPAGEPVRRIPIEPEPSPASREDEITRAAPETGAAGESGGAPQFCHNCGKKLPHAANFCPGCGTRLAPQKSARTSPVAHGPAHPHEKKVRKIEKVRDDEAEEGESPGPAATRPPAKKVPKGSEMTILHKFLRR